MDQKLLMNCVLCFLIGFFFHSVMKFGFCGRSVEGFEGPCESKPNLENDVDDYQDCLSDNRCCIQEPRPGHYNCVTRDTTGSNCGAPRPDAVDDAN